MTRIREKGGRRVMRSEVFGYSIGYCRREGFECDFAEDYLSLRGKHVPDILDKEIIQGQEMTTLCGELLALGKIETLKKLPQMGVNFTPRQGETSFLQVLASCGYPSPLMHLGRTVKNPGLRARCLRTRRTWFFHSS
jgi:hypothetical protein